MIISFSVSNFRSFAGEETLNLVASGQFKDHPEHLYPIPGTNESVLRTAVLYGANGAGKSNLFKALRYVRAMALETRDKEERTGRESFRLGMDGDKLTEFDLQFIFIDQVYRFGFKVDDQVIVEEWLLRINGSHETVIYERKTEEDGKVKVSLNKDINFSDQLKALATVGGPRNQTFLATCWANLDLKEYTQAPTDIHRATAWHLIDLIMILPDGPTTASNRTLFVENNELQAFSSTFLKGCSTGIDRLMVSKNEISEEIVRSQISDKAYLSLVNEANENPEQTARKYFKNKIYSAKYSDGMKFYLENLHAAHKSATGEDVLFNLDDESDGTRRLLSLIPILHTIKKTGKVYFIDEIDRSLHPLLIWQFLEYYLMTYPNQVGQVIVTTHEANLLDTSLLRRDEIWFAEKDQYGGTKLYSLADFKVRNDLDIKKHYLKGRFGAVPFLGDIKRLQTPEESLHESDAT